MKLRTYTAPSIQAALRLVREELGSEASVLHTREIASPLSRWLGGRLIEVTASAEVTAPSRFSTESSDVQAVAATRIPAAELQNFRQTMLADLLRTNPHEPSLVEQLAGAARRSASELPVVSTLRRLLRQSGVSDRLVNGWCERLSAELVCDPDCHLKRAARRLRQIAASELTVAGPIQLTPGCPRIVAFVGPTGVGKTTSLAKIAAHFHLHEQRNVGLITTDTFRIGAADQLQTYAEIIDLPMEVAATTQRMADAVERLRGNDLILIDTAGRSPRDAVRMQEVRALLAAAQPDEVHLVQSCGVDEAGLAITAQAFAAAGADRLILTKFDECDASCRAGNRLFETNLPLSYVTDGQNVPRDLQPASALKLAEMILPPDEHSGV